MIKFLFIFTILLFNKPVFATKDIVPIDAVLVLDVSRSMRTADPDKTSRDAMILFLEKLTENRDRAGVVIYAGNVENSLELHIINDENHKTIKKFIFEQEYASWTDHGLGLIEAINIINFDETRQGIIVFLTDGNMNVNPASIRTNEIAQKDVYTAISIAQELNIPIHTIGLDFDGNLGDIEYISAATRGLSFKTSDANDIPDIIDAFFSAMVTVPPPEFPVELPVELLIESLALEPQIKKVISFPFNEKPVLPRQPSSNNKVIAITIFLFGIIVYLIKKSRSPKRVFTGRLEIIRNKTTLSCNLIEYGRYSTLARLLKQESCPMFKTIIFTPSPIALSYMPKLQIKCKNANVKFIKDFIEQDISKGLSLETGAAGVIEFEDEHIFIKYI